MMNTYKLHTIMMDNGERFPIIIDGNGKPDFYTTVYSTSMLRACNLSSATMENALRAVIVLKMFLDMQGIDLKERFNEGIVFHLNELNSLVRICRLPSNKIQAFFMNTSRRSVVRQNVLRLEKYRQVSPGAEEEVSRALIATRLMYITKYLSWRIERHALNLSIGDARRGALLSTKSSLSDTIKSLSPRVIRYGGVGEREGLAPGAWGKVLDVIAPFAPNNPWKDEFVRVRNELMILWLYYLGIRKGELLNVRVGDIQASEDTVFIQRRADDPADPRKNQPKVKTYGRELKMHSLILEKTDNYIFYYRRNTNMARKHLYLFVSKLGLPLSLNSLAKVFSVLRAKCPDIPRDFTPHVLRHSWNDNFSEDMDKGNVSEEEEKKLRASSMGWKETSETAAIYTRRHIRKKSQEASLAMQQRLLGESKDE